MFRLEAGPTSAPTLESERLILRDRRFEDFPDFLAMQKDQRLQRYITGEPLSDEDAWQKFIRMTGHWALMGYGMWVIEERESGAFVGETGFAEFHRDIEPSHIGVPEMGWLVSPDFQGKGYASEAVRAAIAWGDGHFREVGMCCIINPDNKPSIRVAEKAGFVQTGSAPYKKDQALRYHRAVP